MLRRRRAGRSGGDARADESGARDAPGSGDPDGTGLGEWLRERREERGYDLDRVEQDTRIGRSYIDAIEHDQFELLPAPVYARGFVRSYARYLGLDVDEALARMPSDLPRPPGLEPLPGLRRREGLPAIPSVPRRWLLLAVLVLAAGAAAFFVGVPRFFGPADEAAPDAVVDATPEVPPAATVAPFAEGTTPDLRGVDRDEAERVLGELGVTVLVIEVETPDTPPGRVFAQSPAPGESLDAGDAFTLIVASAEAEE